MKKKEIRVGHTHVRTRRERGGRGGEEGGGGGGGIRLH